MEINGLGFINTDNYRLSAAAGVNNPQHTFEELLRKANASQSDDSYWMSGRRSAGQDIDKSDQLYHLCLELETFIIKNLVNGMRNTVQKSGLVDDSFAGKMYEDMLYEEYAKELTKNAGFGLAEQAYRQLKGLN